MSGLTALVLAGSRPGRDAFAEQHGAAFKALIPVAGEPMVRRPVRALLGSTMVENVRVLAQEPESIGAVLPASPRLTVARSEGTIAETLDAVIRDPATHWPVLVTTADHALLDAAMVEEFCDRARGADVAIGLVERAALVRRLPGTQRTWIRFKGGSYSGANLFLLGSPAVARAIDLWRSVEQDRKKGWRLIAALGPGVLLGAALRLLTLEQVMQRMGRRLGLELRAVELSDPLAAVDVDKPQDHALVEAILADRA